MRTHRIYPSLPTHPWPEFKQSPPPTSESQSNKTAAHLRKHNTLHEITYHTTPYHTIPYHSLSYKSKLLVSPVFVYQRHERYTGREPSLSFSPCLSLRREARGGLPAAKDRERGLFDKLANTLFIFVCIFSVVPPYCCCCCCCSSLSFAFERKKRFWSLIFPR